MILAGSFFIRLSEEIYVKLNPTLEYGQSKIWNMTYNVSEVEDIFKNIFNYRANNQEEINVIANWYKDNFLCI